MKKICKVFLYIVITVSLLVMAVYVSLTIYYRDRFSMNTWVNGVYCTGKSVEEVNSELLSKVKAPIVVLTDLAGDTYEIPLDEVGYQSDYLSELEQLRMNKNPYLWIDNLGKVQSLDMIPDIAFSKDELYKRFCEIPIIKNELEKQTVFGIVFDNISNCYVLEDTLKNRLDVDIVWNEVLNAIESKTYLADMRKLQCTYDNAYTEEQKQTLIQWEKISDFQQCALQYDMGAEQIAFTPDIMAGFLQKEDGFPIFDEAGELMLDEAAVEAYIINLAAEYDTYGKERIFTATSGKEITLTKGNYGTTLDQKAEVEFLMKNLMQPEMHGEVVQLHVPAYEREAFARGKNDIGGTYIEIDLTSQKMYYYVDYEPVIETDIVSGDMKRKWSTPEGVYSVYNKQRNRTLKGPGYESFVKYWVPVYKGIGVHDASWRDEFGGEEYLKNGSHGCINTPQDIMSELYDLVEIGTPVIMFYEKN